MHITFNIVEAAMAWNTCMVLAFVTAIYIQWKEGRRLGFDQATWLPFLAVFYGCFVLGERVGAFTLADWQRLLAEGNLPELTKKSALGSSLIVLPVIFFLKKRWRLPAGMIDSLLLPLPLTLVIGRVGCLLAGCCHGQPTDGSWGICYGPGMPAYDLQVMQGLLPNTAAASLAVHPTQLFSIAAGLLGFWLLWHLRKQAARPGQLALLVMVLLSGTRFFVEFFREAAIGRGLLGDAVGGLNLGQWSCLAIGLAAMLTYAWRENFATAKKQVVPAAAPVSPAKAEVPERTALLLAVALGALIFSPVLKLDEELILLMACTPALILLGKLLWQSQAGKHAIGPAAMLSMATATLIAVPLDTLPPMDKGQRWFEMGAGGTIGAFANITRDCDGNVVEQDKIKVSAAAFDANFNWGLKNGRAGIGLRSSVGMTDGPETSAYSDFYFKALGAYGILDKKAIGIRLGYLNAKEEYGDGNLPSREPSRTKAVPIIDLRVGKVQSVNFFISTFEGCSFSYYPEPVFSLGIGYGFKDASGATQLRFGSASINSESALIMTYRAPIFQSAWSLDGGIFVQKNVMFSLGVRRRFYSKM